MASRHFESLKFEQAKLGLSVLQEALTDFLERRFPARHVSLSDIFEPGKDTSGHFVSTKNIDNKVQLEIIDLANSDEPDLTLSLTPGTLKLKTEYQLKKHSEDSLLVTLATRFIDGYLSIDHQPTPADIKHLEENLLRNGDILLEVDRHVLGWMTSPHGITYLTEDGLFLNDQKIYERVEEIEMIEAGEDGIYLQISIPDAQEKMQVIKIDAAGLASDIYTGDTGQWLPYKDSIIVRTAEDELRINGKALFFTGMLDNGWSIVQGQVVTVRTYEDHQRPHPAGGYFPPGGYSQFMLNGETPLYELKTHTYDDQAKDWLPIASIKPTLWGIVVLESSERSFKERYERANWNRSSATLDDRWEYSLITTRNTIQNGSVLYTQGNNPIDDNLWYPCINEGSIKGVVVKVGNQFLYRSNN
jgi:hypothetical protein